jgi:hypothetical protein
MEAYEGCCSYPIEIVRSHIDPADPGNPENLARGIKALRKCIAEWSEYDFSPGQNTKAFIEASKHAFRPPTIEAVPDAEELESYYHQVDLSREELVANEIAIHSFRYFHDYALGTTDQRIEWHSRNHGNLQLKDTLGRKKLGWLWCENTANISAANGYLHQTGFGFDGSDPMRQMERVPNANHFVSNTLSGLQFSFLSGHINSFIGKIRKDSLKKYYH